MSDILKYKGYKGRVEYSAEDRCLHGKILGLQALVTFECREASEVEKVFRESVDDYLDLCKRHGIEPEREYSGQFVVRINPELHRRLALTAEAEATSLNAIVAEACEQRV
jgi:predicted HicB family RNase H-like nuclease